MTDEYVFSETPCMLSQNLSHLEKRDVKHQHKQVKQGEVESQQNQAN